MLKPLQSTHPMWNCLLVPQLDKATADAAEFKAGYDKAAVDAAEFKAGFDKAAADAAEFKAGYDKLTVDTVEQQAQVRPRPLLCWGRGSWLASLIASRARSKRGGGTPAFRAFCRPLLLATPATRAPATLRTRRLARGSQLHTPPTFPPSHRPAPAPPHPYPDGEADRRRGRV